MYMTMSNSLQPENQVIEREEESSENLRSNCVKEKKGKKCKLIKLYLGGTLWILITYQEEMSLT